MQFVFTPPPTAAVPVWNASELFPVHRIYCVGRNYADHAMEMGGTGRETPFFFMKPADAVLPILADTVGQMHYPTHTSDLHHEIELVVAIGIGGRAIKAVDAVKHIWGYAIGIDMTRRDLQAEAKKLGRPWCIAKGFDDSAPIGPIHRISETGVIGNGAIYLNVNAVSRQSSDISQLIWSVAETIEVLSGYFALQPGDLIFSGTPSGVAAVKQGDLIESGIEGLGSLSLQIV